MRHDRQSALTESTLRELFCRNGNFADARPKTMLALLFYHMNGMDEGLEALKELNEQYGRYLRLRVCPDEHILNHFNIAELAGKAGVDDWVSLENAEQVKENIDYFFIPVLPFSAVSDLLRFNDTRQPIRLLLWSLMSGKKVSAYSAGADPYHQVWKEAGLNHGTPFLKYEMQKQLQQLRGFGIQLIKNHAQLHTYFKQAVLRNEKHIITAETIKEYAEAGSRFIDIKEGMIITPLARDAAKEYQIEISERRA